MHLSSGALGDLNGVGRDDLLVSDPQKDCEWVARGAANGFLGAQQRSTGFVFGGGARIACADVDADGFRDTLVALKTGAVMRGDGAGSLSKAIGAFGSSIGDDHLVDFAAGGALDLVGIDSEGRLATYLNLRVAPSSTAAVGYGSYGCWSQLGVTANQPPKVGSSASRITATSAPRKSAGMLILSDAGSEIALDPFFLAVALHVDWMQAHQVAAAALFTDHVGTVSAHLPIPNAPSLVNAHIWAQPLFAESVGYRCGSSPYYLTTGRAVKFTIFP
ncbi:MAG: VCBS repeat-containing protein [Planctomycetes bacterium]|nr:VCBS repeat-containing protein [Planctomycetota bacterium]